VRRTFPWIAVAAEIVGAERVDDDQDHCIRPALGSARPTAAGQKDQGEQARHRNPGRHSGALSATRTRRGSVARRSAAATPYRLPGRLAGGGPRTILPCVAPSQTSLQAPAPR
jgi:hypothetical protein